MSTDRPLHLVIAIPTYGGMAFEHVEALLRLQGWLGARGIRSQVIHQGMTEIARARNSLAARFLSIEAATHLLFIDSDIEFQPEAVEALLDAARPVVGAIYPKRKLHLDRLIAAARRLTDRDEIVASALDFAVVPDGANAEVTDGLCRVAGVGMGLCLIRREVFAALLATGRMRREPAELAGDEPNYGFFDQLLEGEDFYSEDMAFCRRWRTLCGGEVWALLDHAIGHVGTMVFRSRMIDALNAAAALAR